MAEGAPGLRRGSGTRAVARGFWGRGGSNVEELPQPKGLQGWGCG